MSLKILHKGLILVLLPLVINTVWISLLNGALSKSQKLIENERYQTKLLVQLNSAIVEYGTIVGSAMTFLAMRREGSKTRAREHLDIFKERIENLKKLTANDPENRKLFEGLSAGIDKQFSIIDQFKTPETTGYFETIFTIKNFKDFAENARVRNEYMLRVIAGKEKELETMQRNEDEAASRVRFIVYTGIATNLLVALFLLLLFYQNITQRLSVLVDNAYRLPQNLPLSKVVGGADELSELDIVLHRAGDQLAQATEFRHSLMQMMAHDLRSPLSSSLIALELLSRSDLENLSPSGRKQVGSISKSINRLLGLIGDLLMIESLETGKLELEKRPVDVKEMTNSAVESVAALATAKNIAITSGVVSDFAVFDQARIIQVLVNLLSNAVKFSPPGSEIKITTVKSAAAMKFTVSDQGPGLRRSDIEQLFQKHYQTEDGKKAGGSGLGLAICKMIVESHGGTIGVESQLGSGSTFWFTIPYLDQ